MNDDPNRMVSNELEYLKELEFGDTSEAVIRLVSVVGAGILIHLYTGWFSALIWPVHFVIAWSLHAAFTYFRSGTLSPRQMGLSVFLFGNLQVAFGWMPLVLFADENRALMLVGGALISAQLLFLVRRNDRLKAYQITQITLVAVGSAYVYASFFPLLDTTLAFIGVALALIGLNYYFYRSLVVARRMRESYERAANQAHQAKKMAAIGQLAGGVAHDFNNNLTAIMGGMELAKLEQNRKERDQILDVALAGAAQAAKTVQHLMVFARKEQVISTNIEISQLLSELDKLTSRLIPASVTFEVVNCDPSFSIVANRNLLLSGLVNIVANSIDAMPKGGVVKLWSERIRLHESLPTTDGGHIDPGEYVQISVKDTGHGIPKEILPKVLDPFFTTKPPGKGTGLGLSMVSGMIKELQGGLLIASSADGTEISLLFPEKKGEPTAT